MQAKLAWAVLNWAVRYLRDHPEKIPGTIDDKLIPWIAEALGV